jgi:hypothetical protein
MYRKEYTTKEGGMMQTLEELQRGKGRRAAMTRHYTVVLVALLVAVGIAVAAVASQPGPGRKCFPPAGWGPASESLRPCVEVTKIYEDGSFRFRISNADGTVRYGSGIGALDR